MVADVSAPALGVGQVLVGEPGGTQAESLEVWESSQRGENLVGKLGVVMKQHLDDVTRGVTVQRGVCSFQACFGGGVVCSSSPAG